VVYSLRVRRPSLTTALLPVALLLAACVDTDAAVFVAVAVDAPRAEVTTTAFGIALTGAFTLTLHLGPRATGASQVQLLSAKVLDAKQTGEIIGALPASTTTTLPVTVDLDSDVAVPFTFDTGAKLPADLQGKLCDPAGIVIAGAIQDSLQSTSTPFASAVIHATGCP